MNSRTFLIAVVLFLGLWALLPTLAPTNGTIVSSWRGPGDSTGISGAAAPSVPTTDTAAAATTLDTYLNDLAARNQWSGAVLVAKRGTVLLAKGYGFADATTQTLNTADTRFRLASITKQFTAMAAMQLVDQGKLRLDSSVCEYMLQCPDIWRTMTIKHLLTHTSGLPNFTDFADYEPTMALPTSPDGLVARFRDLPLLSEPGAVYRYGNSGYVLLGAIIERVSGQSYGDYLRDHIFSPLGMDNSGYDVGETHVAQGYISVGVPCSVLDATTLYAAGGLYSSARDLYRWDQALYTPALLPDALRAQIFTPQAGQYGFGWIVSRHGSQRVVEHPGLMSGAATHISRLPEAGITVIVLSNLETADVYSISSHLIDLALQS
jgi:CubicO group peptidase (beta-lactamase class C family)